MKLLALDTASELCSAALWLDGQLLARETVAPRAHAALILPMIDALLAEAGLALTALDAIAFGRGPGAFTGVRLAAAIAQGLGFAAQRPLIAISDLRAAATQALQQVADAHGVLVCQDARMEEVYWGCFERGPSRDATVVGDVPMVGGVGVEGVAPAAAVELPASWQGGIKVIAAGSGFAAYPELSRRLHERLALTLPQLQPRAREIAWLAAQDGMATAIAAEEALPVYLRDRVTGTAGGSASSNS
ncbi:MAG TPA: tRNA (adenosine(37)-N6)-threonylcarbamoyltransferase complex dimerization subunit type 1 TsaB [Steroidobacteraceae bacterium]|jgi:tRNA threonylcarbamoyladenosine biosynthesis protein TsaB|nr:tRNA (adenosine(37)-N6)-threonylcarbamoyltransferase complex dimerization subunit type 1 TsaB [Steroidobacteraceae bacterium]